MRNGFSFKGRHSSEFGVTVRTKSRPIRPEAKSFTMDIPCHDGAYDFSESNPAGREYFYDRTFSFSISVYAENLCAMQDKLSELSLWLIGSGELIFDDMPYAVWRGKISDEVIYMPEHDGRKAVLEVSFRAKPFAECIFSADGPVLDTGVPLDTRIPISIDALLTFTVLGSGNINILNFGDRPIRPVISITGNASDIVMETGGKTLSFTAGGNVRVDCEKQTVTNSKGSVNVQGEFFELAAGMNSVRIENSNTSALTVEVSYMPEFNYNVNFEKIDWGEDDA